MMDTDILCLFLNFLCFLQTPKSAHAAGAAAMYPPYAHYPAYPFPPPGYPPLPPGYPPLLLPGAYVHGPPVHQKIKTSKKSKIERAYADEEEDLDEVPQFELTPELRKCQRVLSQLTSDKYAFPFKEPVDPV